MRGADLKELIIKKKSFQEEEVAVIARSLLQSIAYCHKRGIVHRDIRPENILLEVPEETLQFTKPGAALFPSGVPKKPLNVKMISFKEAVEIIPP